MIGNMTSRYQVYVARGLTKIQESTSIKSWRFVPTAVNSATDDITRCTIPEDHNDLPIIRTVCLYCMSAPWVNFLEFLTVRFYNFISLVFSRINASTVCQTFSKPNINNLSTYIKGSCNAVITTHDFQGSFCDTVFYFISSSQVQVKFIF